MTALYILAGVVLTLFLIGQIRIGGRAVFNVQGFFLWVKFGWFYIQILPEKPRKPKEPKPKKPKQGQKKPKPGTPPAPLMERAGGALAYAQALLPVVLEAVSGTWRGLRVNDLLLELTAASSDPADTAILYGRANAVLGALWRPLTQTLHVKNGTARIRMDFLNESMTLYASAVLSIKLGQILWIGLRAGVKTLFRVLAVRKRRKEIKQRSKKGGLTYGAGEEKPHQRADAGHDGTGQADG